jgi:hypothetical protein
LARILRSFLPLRQLQQQQQRRTLTTLQSPPRQQDDFHSNVLTAFGLPSNMVECYGRLFSSCDPLYPLIGEIDMENHGDNGMVLWPTALTKAFPLDVFEISYVPQAIRSFVHHFYPAYSAPMVDYVKRLGREKTQQLVDQEDAAVARTGENAAACGPRGRRSGS